MQAASAGCHKGIIELLLENGVDVNAQGGYYGNPVQAASFQGHVVVVKSLLRSGANASCSHAVQVRNGYHVSQPLVEVCNTLHAASLRGHKAIVELLLNHGVVTHHLDAALEAALEHSFYSVAQLLMKHRAKQT